MCVIFRENRLSIHPPNAIHWREPKYFAKYWLRCAFTPFYFLMESQNSSALRKDLPMPQCDVREHRSSLQPAVPAATCQQLVSDYPCKTRFFLPGSAHHSGETSSRFRRSTRNRTMIQYQKPTPACHTHKTPESSSADSHTKVTARQTTAPSPIFLTTPWN